jgi:single-strand DNA-binding protein
MAVNKFIMSGNLTKDAELISNQNDRVSRARIRLAVNKVRKDAQGERQTSTDFFSITLFGNTAENAVKYLGKGSKILVEGALEADEWEKDGVKIYSVGLVGREIDYLDTQAPATET